jgi:NADPH2:quinone reductase
MAGSHASKRAVPARSTWSIPEGLDAARAACVPVALGTAEECLFTAGNLEAGQTALIHAGAGGVGMAAIQLAKQAGATVISTASSDEKLERLKRFGLDHVRASRAPKVALVLCPGEARVSLARITRSKFVPGQR